MSSSLETRTTSVGTYRFHSVHAGDGPPVVLLHGLSGSHHWWHYTLPSLARTYRVHVPELIGFGRSRPAPEQPSIGRMAELVSEWMDRMALDRPHLVGHSMGAQVSLHIAARWRERLDRLVLVSAAGIPRAFTLREMYRFATELIPPRAWGRATFLPTIAVDAVRAGPRSLIGAVRHILMDDVRPLLERIATPTLLVWGEHDGLTPLRYGEVMAQRIPDARLVVIPGAAHNPMADRPGEFNEVLLRFLGGGDVGE